MHYTRDTDRNPQAPPNLTRFETDMVTFHFDWILLNTSALSHLVLKPSSELEPETYYPEFARWIDDLDPVPSLKTLDLSGLWSPTLHAMLDSSGLIDLTQLQNISITISGTEYELAKQLLERAEGLKEVKIALDCGDLGDYVTSCPVPLSSIHLSSHSTFQQR